MASKFVRRIIFTDGNNTGSNSGAGPIFPLKFIYDFWGFCINGTSSLGTPGGMPTSPTNFPGNFTGVNTTIAVSSNGQSLPQTIINVASTTNFPTSGTIFVYTNLGTQTVNYTGTNSTQFTGCSGGSGTMSTGNNVTSSSLMTIGSDGYTNATTQFRADGYTSFFANSTIPFTGSMIGKHLVTWKPGSGSSEDAIYPIIGINSANEIYININTGGTPAGPNDGYRPSVTSRSSINYRVIDVGTAGKTAGATNDNNYIVFQLDPTGINAGQNTSQIQLLIGGGGVPASNFSFKISPAGTWNGSTFTDATGTFGTPALTNAGGSSGTMSVNIWGDKDYLICHSKDTGNPNGAGWNIHWEIPQRLHTLAQDQNPVAIVTFPQFSGIQFQTTSTTSGYGGGWAMRCSDANVRNYRAAVRALSGDGNANLSLNIAQIPGNSLSDFRAGANQFTGTLLNSSGFLSLPGVASQYSLARARIRRVKFVNTFMAQFTRMSTVDGDFIFITQGCALPWDKTVLPYGLFPF